MRALARSLVRGDSDADDLLQDAAVAALEHPPALDRPVRPWLATVILNRWRMDRRSAARRRAREQAAIGTPEPERIDPLERAQTLRRLGEAVIALPDLYRDVVIARYFDGKSSITIANELGIPPVTVRTRLLRALEKLRTAMDEAAPRRRWQRALVPLPLHAWLAPAKVITFSIVLAFLCAFAYLVWPVPRAATRSTATASTPAAHAAPARPGLPDEPTPGQGRASVEPATRAIASGRVIDGATGEGVANAALTFTGAASVTAKSGDDGSFELTADPGAYVLAGIAAQGYLPFVSRHPGTRYELVRERAVRGLTLILYPAIDYRGRVVDGDGKPVASARVTVVGEAETGETWTSDRDGEFTFHAAAGAMLEASAGDRVGWASVVPAVEVTHRLAIAVTRVAAHDQTISGRVVDESGKPIADAFVHATPEHQKMDMYSSDHEQPTRAPAVATSAADGTFELHGLDSDTYELSSDVEGRAPAMIKNVAGGTRGVAIELTSGQALAGTVASADGTPVPAFTLFVFHREGAARDLVLSRSLVDASGHFSVHVTPGAYELVAAANGWAQSAPAPATAPGGELRLVMSPGAILRGKVVSASDGSPIARARVTREALHGGTSAQPANVATVTRADGSFELRGVPPGPVSIVVMGEGFDHKIEAGMTAREDGDLAPVQVALEPIAPGGAPKLQYVGVGISTSPDGDALRIDAVVPSGGAAAAGITVGDRIVAIDGVPVADTGEVGAVARIRGIANTTVAFLIRRADRVVTIIVTRAWLSA
jgi:RNA polymerase sigma-70 factor (ECF subfamily)